MLPSVVSHVLTRPYCLALWWASWHYLCALCRYGGFRKNGVMLLLCLICWFCVLAYGVWLFGSYRRHGCRRCRAAESEDGALRLLREGADKDAVPFDGSAVKWYVKRKDALWIFLKNREALFLDLKEWKPEERDFLELKLSVGSALGRSVWRRWAGVLLAAVMLYGCVSVVESAIPYHGKLAWYLKDLEDKRTVTLVHDNVYETGVDGILEDIRKKVDLPQTLCLATSFNLHFSLDGTVQTFDTMLYGFDEAGNFAGSYLVSYNAARSSRISIYLHGVDHAQFQTQKDLQPFLEAVRAMPLEQNASFLSRWDDSFGILYYGVREWMGGEGVRFLNYYGESWDPPFWERDFRGYGVSLFCLNQDDIPPLRYLYMGYRTPPGSGILP